MELLAGAGWDLPVRRAMNQQNASPGLPDGPKCTGFGWIEVPEPASILHGSINHSAGQDETQAQQPRVAVDCAVKRCKGCDSDHRLDAWVASRKLNCSCGTVGASKHTSRAGQQVLTVDCIQYWLKS